MKHVLVALSVVASAMVFAHGLAAQGVPDCSSAGGLNFICGLQNPEDVVQIPQRDLLLATGMAPGAGLTLVNTRAKMASTLYVGSARHDRARFRDCPGPPDPKLAVLHGLALRPAANAQAAAPADVRYTVYATHHGGRESVEVFELTFRPGAAEPALAWVGCVLLPPKLSANSVAAFSDGTLVATVLFLPGRTFEDAFAFRNTGIVLQWTPGAKTFVEMKGTELVANNGIDTSPDDQEFYVASTTMRRIYAFSRARPGAGPLRYAQLKDFGPDNVRWTADNRLITAGLVDDEPACGGRPKNEEGIRCPMGYAVATIDPRTMAVTEIARGPRTPAFTGTAMAAVVNNELWLGSFFANRLAYRSLK